MKLLLDQHLSFRLLDSLQNLYPESNHVKRIGMSEATDKEIWVYAKANCFTIVTKDSDFQEYSVLFGVPPKVIWLKCGNSAKQRVLDLLTKNHEVIRQFINNTKIIAWNSISSLIAIGERSNNPIGRQTTFFILSLPASPLSQA